MNVDASAYIAVGFLVATVVVTAGIFGYIMTRNLRRK
jgi:hypothetical protein